MEHRMRLTIGPRTRQDILKGRDIQKLKDGAEKFEDYWTDSDEDEESSTFSKKTNLSSNLPEDIPSVQSRNFLKNTEDSCISIQEMNGQSEFVAAYEEIQSSGGSSISQRSNKINGTPTFFSKICFQSPKKSILRSAKKDLQSKKLLNDDNNSQNLDSGSNTTPKRRKNENYENTNKVKKRSRSRRSIMPLVENILETSVNFDASSKQLTKQQKSSVEIVDSSHIQTKQQSTSINERNISSTSDENCPADTSLNSKKDGKKQSRIKIYKKKQWDKNDEDQNQFKGRVVKKSKSVYNIDTSQLQANEQIKSINERNISNASEGNCHADTSMNSTKNIDNASNINIKKVRKKQLKVKNYNNKQYNKNDNDDQNQSKGEIAKKSKSVDSIDTSQQQANQPNISVNEQNISSASEANYPADTSINSISEGNCPADISMNFEKNVDNASNVNITKVGKKQLKIKNYKNKQCEKNNNDDLNQSNIELAEKSKSGSPKNNSYKVDKKSPRRSTRQRLAPLARWRNERLLYRFKDGNIELIGIDKGTEEDVAFLKLLEKKIVQKKKIVKPKKARIFVENKKKRIDVHKKFDLVPWGAPKSFISDSNTQPEYSIKRMIDTNHSSFGFLHIDIGKSKPTQYMPDDDLQMNVIKGSLEVEIETDVFTIERNDMFIVPRGCSYSIKNIGNKKAFLSYAVGDFNFTDC